MYILDQSKDASCVIASCLVNDMALLTEGLSQHRSLCSYIYGALDRRKRVIES